MTLAWRRCHTVLLAMSVALLATACTTSSSGSPAASSRPTAPAVVSASPSSPPAAAPPYIARAAWVSDSRGRSLRVYPTTTGRVAALSGRAEAWSEVLRYAADAGTPGMQAQFDCHWTFARIVEPDKTSWNLEPWRPVVSRAEMQRTRCNPGGAEETVPSATGLRPAVKG